MKRKVDVIVSSILLILSIPLFVIIGLIIKTTLKGRIFFIQSRFGKNNKEFNIYKFRTMKVDTPNVATDRLKNPCEFMTPVGKALRNTSLDELPQLINILRGEMSFVGPRPALHNQYDLKEERVRAGVDKLVPGLTGWAQVNGRDSITLEEKVKLDKEYLKQQNFMLDMKILLRTLKKVLTKDGIQEGDQSKQNKFKH